MLATELLSNSNEATPLPPPPLNKDNLLSIECTLCAGGVLEGFKLEPPTVVSVTLDSAIGELMSILEFVPTP